MVENTRKKKSIRRAQYQELSLQIFRDEEAADACSEDLDISDSRRNLIKRFISLELVDELKKASTETANQRAKIDALFDSSDSLGRSTKGISSMKTASPDSIWTISKSEMDEIDASELKPRNMLDRYARCVHREGRLEGMLWTLIGEARNRWKVKKGKKRATSNKVSKEEETIEALLRLYFAKYPGHRVFEDHAVAKAIQGIVDSLPSEAEEPDVARCFRQYYSPPSGNGIYSSPGGKPLAFTTLWRRVRSVRDKHPSMRSYKGAR